uniref:DSL domain-containing protein n=1 Tax=Parascaris univalens TaxID=6257 RepID=A0A915C0H1_PARUN
MISTKRCYFMFIAFSYTRQCDADWYGFVCSTFCKPIDDNFKCSTCDPITGEQVCCEGIAPGTVDCWRNETDTTTTTSSTTGNTSKHVDLYFWIIIALSCFCIILIVVGAVSVIFAFYFYGKYKNAANERFRPYRMNYGNSNDIPQTTHPERQLPNDTWTKDNFSYSYVRAFAFCDNHIRVLMPN